MFIFCILLDLLAYFPASLLILYEGEVCGIIFVLLHTTFQVSLSISITSGMSIMAVEVRLTSEMETILAAFTVQI